MAADVGTLQRLPKVVGNDSLVRELVYTARRFEAEEAKQFGLIRLLWFKLYCFYFCHVNDCLIDNL